jgi:putative heme-binding domain-containing protein
LLHISDKRLAPLVRKALSASGGLPNPDRQKVIDSLLYVVKTKGNAEAGKTVFQNHCAKCHTYQGTGNKIGPDLTGMAVHSKEHLLIEILDPSRSVEGNYRQYLIATKSGQVLTGLLVAESKTAVELLDAEGKKHVLPRDEIEQIQGSPKSLMPEGFEQQLKPQELADLLEFLTQRGKYIPLPLERAATMSSARGMFYRAEARQERLVFPNWEPKIFRGVPFHVLDPQDGHKANVILLYSPQGTFPPKMPKSVEVPCNVAASAIHMLSGVSGWGFPLGEKGSVSLIVRLHYEDGRSEDHELKNGEHFADYIRRVDVPRLGICLCAGSAANPLLSSSDLSGRMWLFDGLNSSRALTTQPPLSWP